MPIFSTDGVVPLQQQLLTWNCCSYCVVMRTLLIIVIAFSHSDPQTMSNRIPIPAATNPMVVSSAFRQQTELDTIPLNKDRNMRSTLSSTEHGHLHSVIKKLLLLKVIVETSFLQRPLVTKEQHLVNKLLIYKRVTMYVLFSFGTYCSILYIYTYIGFGQLV